MRQDRLIGENGGIYHCVSRCADPQRALQSDDAKEYFRDALRRFEEFLHLRVLTYCLLPDRFHLLVEAPAPDLLPGLNEAGLRRLLRSRYRGIRLQKLLEEVDAASRSEAEMDALLERYRRPMGDLGEFMRLVKQTFTLWYNRVHDRQGTLWERRYRSVLVEDAGHALMTTAAYIDLAAVRAGLAENPADYPWCGLAEALAGDPVRRDGILRLAGSAVATPGKKTDHQSELSRYRTFVCGGEKFDRQKLEKKLSAGETLTLQEALHCEVRYFSDGAAIGSQEFVEGVFQNNPQFCKSRTRETGARRMKFAEWGDLYTLRDLQVRVISVGDQSRPA